ncbi:HAD family hydrolase [Verrucomicrobiota bacterium]
MQKLLVFDLDGTLIDSRRDLAKGINLMRAHYGLQPLDYETVSGYVGDGVRKLVERSLCDAPHIHVDDALSVNKAFYREHVVDDTCFYPGVEAGLKAFAEAGHTLAVLTNKQEDMTRIILKHFGIADLFKHIIGGGHETFALKPNPDALNFLIKASGLPAEQCWMIGDHRTDMMVAERAGISTVFCEYGIGITGEHQPTHRIQEFSELAAIFN